jgi:hypothetical protein
MEILYIADGRSPTALSWISYFIQAGHAVHLVSTYPCEVLGGAKSQFVVPLALSTFYGQTSASGTRTLEILRKLLPVRVRTVIRRMAVPLSFSQAIARMQGIIERLKPDLIHAMRIPYEGMLVAQALERSYASEPGYKKIPLIISVWGNDLTMHAQSSKSMAAQTRQTLQMCTGLHTDCQRDQRLAVEWGFETGKPRIVLPGGGGVQMELFHPPEIIRDETPARGMVNIINPRGFRAYVRNDTFFQAIPLVIEEHPEAHFICPGMKDEGQAQGWVAELGIEDKVDLLPSQTRQQMAGLFQQAQISLSITTHDGTPNTLLEAMACGCFPIAGDIESLREWITPGMNGLLVNPGDASALCQAILQAIQHPELRRKAKESNLQLVAMKADYQKCMREAEEFYLSLISPGKD